MELIQLKKDVRGKLVVYHATQPEIQKWIEELEQEDLESGVTSTEPASHPPEQPTFSSVVS